MTMPLSMVMAALLLLIVAYAVFGALLFRDRQWGVGAILYMASFGGLVLLLLMYGMRG